MKWIWLQLHGLGAAWTGPTGNELVQTPALNAIAAAGITFDRFYSNQTNPQQFWESFLSADPMRPQSSPPVLPVQNRYLLRECRFALPDWLRSHFDEIIEVEPGQLAETVADVVYQFAALEEGLLVIETDQLLPPWIVDDELFLNYFDTIYPAEEAEPPAENAETEPETDDETESSITKEALQIPPWEEELSGTLDKSDRLTWSRIYASFATAVHQLDEEIALWVEWFGKAKLDVSAHWLITSTTGISLGEHGPLAIQDVPLYEESLHGVLLYRPANGCDSPRHEAGLLQPLDFGQLFALPKTFPQRQQIVAHAPKQIYFRNVDWSLRLHQDTNGNWQTELYKQPEDRWEYNELSKKFTEWSEYLSTWLLQQYSLQQCDGTTILKSLNEILQPPELETNEKVADEHRETDRGTG